MAILDKKIRRDRRIAIGSLNTLIKLQRRRQTTPKGSGVDYSEQFTDWMDMYALVETVTGLTIFDDSNTERVVTHRIYIRFIPEVTAETWIILPAQYPNTTGIKDVYLDVLNVENLNDENKFYKLSCADRGDKAKPINWA